MVFLVLGPVFDTVEANCDSEIAKPTSSTDSVPESIVLFGIEEDDQVELEVDSSG